MGEGAIGPKNFLLARSLLRQKCEVGQTEAEMLFCASCKIWVQPIQWVAYMLNGLLDIHEACPCCHERLPQPEPAAV
jgi:hypothetical protein